MSEILLTRTIIAETAAISRQCMNKRQFQTFAGAIEGCHTTAKNMVGNGMRGFVLTFYICPWCGCFHIGRVKVR